MCGGDGCTGASDLVSSVSVLIHDVPVKSDYSL